MSSNEKEVLQLLSVLVSKVQSCQEPLSAQNVGNAVFGISDIEFPGCQALVVSLVARMIEVVFMKSYSFSDISSLISGTDAILQSIVYSDASWKAELESLRGELIAQLQLQDCPISSSRIEAKTISVAESLFSKSLWQANDKVPTDLRGLEVYVDSNIWLHGYEADIVLRINGGYRGMKVNEVVVNVEVDGPSHDSLKSQRHSRIRDWRMRRQGVHVERWKVQLLNKTGKSERLLIELVKKVLSCAFAEKKP